MAVYKSRRKDAAAQFVADARELRKATVRIARKFPASYKYVTTGPLLQLASEVYMNALKGNSIYVHKDMSERDYELRHRYLAAATASADALLGEITPTMAAAVCQSPARRVLVPINHCENIVVGVPDQPIGQLVAAAAQKVKELVATPCK